MNDAKIGDGKHRSPLLPAMLICALLLAGCDANVDLISAIPEKDANEVVAALLDAGIHAEKIPGKDNNAGVRTAAAEVAAAVDTLRRAGLPRDHFTGVGESFKKDGMISSPSEERVRYMYALSQEVADTLSRMDGVLVARVHLVLPDRSPGGELVSPATAAVFIKHRPDETHLGALRPQIRLLVANSIPGLNVDNVSISLVPSVSRAKETSPVWTTVLGFGVHAASAGALVWTLVILSTLAIGGLTSACFLGWRHVLGPKWSARPTVSHD